jgi:hypothetical protein
MSGNPYRHFVREVRAKLAICCTAEHLRATGAIALIVGSWLTLINQADVIGAEGLDRNMLLKIALNYLTPFVVANLGVISRKN